LLDRFIPFDLAITLLCCAQVLLDLHRIKWRRERAKKKGRKSKKARDAKKKVKRGGKTERRKGEQDEKDPPPRVFKTVKEQVADFLERKDESWSAVFDFTRLGIGAARMKQFSHFMKTDGVGCSLVFKKPKGPPPKRYCNTGWIEGQCNTDHWSL
jgi:hypothetical protein